MSITLVYTKRVRTVGSSVEGSVVMTVDGGVSSELEATFWVERRFFGDFLKMTFCSGERFWQKFSDGIGCEPGPSSEIIVVDCFRPC
jgi:hypothetical protein